MTKWVEPTALPRATEHALSCLLYAKIFTRFGVPKEIVTDGGSKFTSKLIKYLIIRYHIKHKVASPYHPQANEKVEGTNKNLGIHTHNKYPTSSKGLGL